MVSAGKKTRRKRKDEKRNLCSAWEGFDVDNRPNDDNVFYGCQEAKQKVKHKCRYLDEKNIVVSHHLLNKPCSSSSERSDVVEKLPPGWDASQDKTLSTKSSVVPPAELSSLSQSVSDTFPTSNNMPANSTIHKRNIIHGQSPLRTSSLELKRTLPLIQWAPAAARVQMTEEPVAWRCKGFVTVNREGKPAGPPQLWKRAFDKKLEWCHGNLARLAHLRKQSPNDALYVARSKAVIRRADGLTVGHEGEQVQDSHVEQNVCRKAETKHTGLPNGSALLVHTHKQAQYNILWRTLQIEGQQDGGHTYKNQTVISMDCSNVSRFSDLVCQTGCQGNRQSSPRHDVTLFHILQVLQSKPVNSPQVRSQRCLKAL